MTIYMPSVDLTRMGDEQKEIMASLLDKDRLTTCPRYSCALKAKMVHHYLLKLLYCDPRWTVPVHWAWGMPHIVEKVAKEQWQEAENIAKGIADTACFGSPQPVCVAHKLYRVDKEDGTFFIMKVA